MNRFKEITEDILSFGGELLLNCDKIMVGVNGDTKAVGDLFSGYDVEIYDNESNDYEFVTLERLYAFINESEDDWKICYVHSKGVSTEETNECIEDWRRYMCYFNLERYGDCLEALDTYDTCGVDLRDEFSPHYSGNFWWSTSIHMKRLKSPRHIIDRNWGRHLCEFWICSQGKHYSFNDCGIDVCERHLQRYPKEKYA